MMMANIYLFFVNLYIIRVLIEQKRYYSTTNLCIGKIVEDFGVSIDMEFN